MSVFYSVFPVWSTLISVVLVRYTKRNSWTFTRSKQEIVNDCILKIVKLITEVLSKLTNLISKRSHRLLSLWGLSLIFNVRYPNLKLSWPDLNPNFNHETKSDQWFRDVKSSQNGPTPKMCFLVLDTQHVQENMFILALTHTLDVLYVSEKQQVLDNVSIKWLMDLEELLIYYFEQITGFSSFVFLPSL